MRGRIAPSKETYKKYQSDIEFKQKTDTIRSKLKKAGIKGDLSLRPDRLNLSEFTFDDQHISSEREHSVSRMKAVRFMQKADIALIRWNGQFINYYDPKGVVYVDVRNKNIRTAFRKEEFNEKVLKLREVLKKNGAAND